MLYSCDALLPTAERYASLKFRRYSRWFRPTRFAWDEALELVAFVETIGGVKFAAFVFHWGHAGVKAYERLRKHMLADAQPYIRANEGSVGLDDGLAVLKAMQDGGWKSHGLPKLVKNALASLIHAGNGPTEVARATGLSVDQVLWAVRPRRNNRALAYGSLTT